MQKLSTPKTLENASLLTRRAMLAGGVAVPVTVALPVAVEAAEASDNHDELVMLLDQRDELVSQHVAAIRILDAIEKRPDRPPARPLVDLANLLCDEHVRKYHTGLSRPVLGIDDGPGNLHDYFESQIEMAINRAKCKPEWACWPEIKALDYDRCRTSLLKQINARHDWEAATGYAGAEEEIDRPLEALRVLEESIFIMRVLSFRDLRIKLELVADDTWTLDDDHLRLILTSIGDFANRDGRPPRRHERAALAGAA